MSALKFAEGYTKPREALQLIGNARKRASIKALGSITHLQKYYASGGAILEGTLIESDNSTKQSFINTLSPRSVIANPPPEVLLRECYADIQQVLEVWGIISYPTPSAHHHHQEGSEESCGGQVLDSPASSVGGDENDWRQLGHLKDGSAMSLNSRQAKRYDGLSIDLLALLESSTRAISSIRMFAMNAPVLLSTNSLSIHRQAAVSAIEMLSILEMENRTFEIPEGGELDEQSQEEVFGDLPSLSTSSSSSSSSSAAAPEGYFYKRLQFGDLERERNEMKSYLMVVQEQLFKPQVEGGAMEQQLERLMIASRSNGDLLDSTTTTTTSSVLPSSPTRDGRPLSPNGVPALPKWMDDNQWPESRISENDDGQESDFIISIERCHSFLEAFRPLDRPLIPDPSRSLSDFLEALHDGYVLCNVFNNFIKATEMPFGLVDKMHEDTRRTWRAADNWRFLIQACKFRLDMKFSEGTVQPIEIVKQTEKGRQQELKAIKKIIGRGIQETKLSFEAVTKKREERLLTPDQSLVPPTMILTLGEQDQQQ